MLTSCFIWRISRCEYLNTRIHLFPHLRVQWARIAGLLFALYVAIIFGVGNLCSRPHCRPPPQPFAVVQPSILTSNSRTNFVAGFGFANCILRYVLLVFDDLITDYCLNSFIYPMWTDFRVRVYVCASRNTHRSIGLNESSGNHGGWPDSFSSCRRRDCIYIMLLSSKTSHRHEKAGYQ
jgi:hypothetical protein